VPNLEVLSLGAELPFAGEEEPLATGLCASILTELGVGGARVLVYVFKVKNTVTKALGGRSACFGSPCFL
jgi:hypothetical protein